MLAMGIGLCHDDGLMYKGFWGSIVKPIVGLSPMDGVTDAAFRAIMARHGRPDVVFTEFTHVQGLLMAPQRLLRDFEYSEAERPVVAQVYGHTPEHFYQVAHVVCELGFDGLDINMGCPARKVVSRHCGAGLIRKPELARQIIGAVREGIRDWARGQTLEDLKLSKRLIAGVAAHNTARDGAGKVPRREIPYSVKTRLGYDDIVIESWMETLLSEEPAVISLHGRTLRQMYRGQADWQAIGRAVKVARGTETLILGNGDLTSLERAAERIQESGVDGVLLGRAAIGNPWIFRGKERLKEISNPSHVCSAPAYIDWRERLGMALEHARTVEMKRGPREFKTIKKHLAAYLRGFRSASHLRARAMQVQSADELAELFNAAQLRYVETIRSEAGRTPPQSDPYPEAAG